MAVPEDPSEPSGGRDPVGKKTFSDDDLLPGLRFNVVSGLGWLGGIEVLLFEHVWLCCLSAGFCEVSSRYSGSIRSLATSCYLVLLSSVFCLQMRHRYVRFEGSLKTSRPRSLPASRPASCFRRLELLGF